jgi:gliding motility-associated-like protein
MIVDDQMQLCLYGVTGSADFPVTNGAYDTQFSGGDASSLSGTGASFPNGTDIVICKFSADGSELIAATFFGGSANDGLNTSNALKYNYADEFRGEINLTSEGNVLMVSSTLSGDIILGNGAQLVPGGGQDIIIASFHPDLTSMHWGSYAGGSGDDSGFSIIENIDGNFFIAGGTASTDFPGMNGYQTIYGGGESDAYILGISSDGSEFVSGSFLGGNDYDQFYFVSKDSEGNICLFGQTESADDIWIHNAGYSNASSGNCIVKLDGTLQNVIWSTLIGTGDNQPNLSPAAFMADLCNRIYICGWGIGPDGGGQLNPSAHLSPMQDLVTTPGCFDNNSVSGDFYMAVFDGNMNSLQYASFMGGDLSSEHVDGGTSRFDRSGIIYQSVCAGCGGNSDFPIFPANAWSANNNSSCNNAVLKFDFEIPMTVASFQPSGPFCVGQPITIQQQSQEANDFFWQFGDGISSTSATPQHVYSDAGIYEITLTVSNPQTCNQEDSLSITIEVSAASSLPDTLYEVCHGAEIDIGPSGSINASTYQWSPETNLSNSNTPNPICTADTIQEYTLYTTRSGCADTSMYYLDITTVSLEVLSDTIVCAGDSIQIHAVSSPQQAQINWSTSEDFSTPISNQDHLIIAVDSSITYFARLEYNGCADTASIAIQSAAEYVQLNDLYKFCKGDTVRITQGQVLPEAIYSWSSNLEIISASETEAVLFVNETGTISLEMIWNECVLIDTAWILLSDLAQVEFEVSPSQSIITAGESIVLQITPADFNYDWQPPNYLDTPFEAQVVSTPPQSIEYTIHITDGDCATQRKASIEVIQASCAPPQVFVPNTFSPNGDGVNDHIYVRANEPQKMLFRIFNRWGELVFESRSPTIGWDGNFRGSEADPDVFTYYLEITCKGGESYFHSGNITLTR